LKITGDFSIYIFVFYDIFLIHADTFVPGSIILEILFKSQYEREICKVGSKLAPLSYSVSGGDRILTV